MELISRTDCIRSNLIFLHGPREEAARDQLIRGNERHVCMYVKQVAFASSTNLGIGLTPYHPTKRGGRARPSMYLQ